MMIDFTGSVLCNSLDMINLMRDSLFMFCLCQLQNLVIDKLMMYQIGKDEVVEQEEGEDVQQEEEGQEGEE